MAEIGRKFISFILRDTMLVSERIYERWKQSQNDGHPSLLYKTFLAWRSTEYVYLCGLSLNTKYRYWGWGAGVSTSFSYLPVSWWEKGRGFSANHIVKGRMSAMTNSAHGHFSYLACLGCSGEIPRGCLGSYQGSSDQMSICKQQAWFALWYEW